MVEQKPSSDRAAQRRRSTRIVQTVPLTVTGVDALGQPFKERTSTISINCHGCKYQSKHYVLKDSWLTLEIPHAQAGEEPHRVRARVAWIQKPRTIRELFQIGAELEVSGNVWGIAFPPEDWFPLPEGAPVIPAAALPPPEGKPEAVPGPAVAEAPPAAGRQVEQLLADAKVQIQHLVQESVASETSRVMREVSAQMQSAAQAALDAAASSSAEIVVHRAIERIDEARRSATSAMQEEWGSVFEQKLTDAAKELTSRLEKATAQLGESLRDKLQEDLSRASQQAEELSAKAGTSSGALATGLEEAQGRLAALQREMTAALDAAREATGAHHRSLEEAAAKFRQEATAAVETARAEWREKLESDMAVAGTAWNSMLDDAVQRGTVRLAEQLDELRREAADQAEQEMQARSAELAKSVEQAVVSVERSVASLRETLAHDLEQASASLKEIDQAVARVKEYEAQAQSINRAAAGQLEQRAGEIISARAADIEKQAEAASQEVLARLGGELDRTARRFLERLSEQAKEQLAPQLAGAMEAGERLAAARAAVDKALETHQEKLQAASDEHVKLVDAQLAQIAADAQREFAEASRAEMARWAAELDAKGTDTQHSTFEALYKASEWYQKKAHTAMQSVLDRLMEDAGGRLREQAAEVSRLFAAELDHRSRSFVEHTQGLLDEASKDITDRALHQLDEYRDTRLATFDDEAHRLAQRTLDKLGEAAGQATAEIQAQIDARIAQARALAASHAEEAVHEFERQMQHRLEEGMAAARHQMEAALEAILNAWEVERAAQQQEWRGLQAKEVNSALEGLRGRLELASNAWLAASVATLHARAQSGITSLAQSTEEKLRETFAQTLAGLADAVSDRLLRLSQEILPPKPPPEEE